MSELSEIPGIPGVDSNRAIWMRHIDRTADEEYRRRAALLRSSIADETDVEGDDGIGACVVVAAGTMKSMSLVYFTSSGGIYSLDNLDIDSPEGRHYIGFHAANHYMITPSHRVRLGLGVKVGRAVCRKRAEDRMDAYEAMTPLALIDEMIVDKNARQTPTFRHDAMHYQLKSRQVRVTIDEDYGMYETQTRFDICDADGKVIDDAQGYGYKTAQSAHKAAAYKFKGGKQKADAVKKFWRQHKEFARKLSEFLLINFKDPPSDAEIVAFAAECGVPGFNPKFIKALP